MRRFVRLLSAGMLAGAALMAAPVVNSVLNPASYALPGMPNYGVAQGSLFVAFGTGLGPSGWNTITAFPLQTTWNNISMKVTVGSTTVDCLPMNSYGAGSTPATQVVGLLPSTVPVGTGTLVLTYNGVPSAPASIKVVARAFGTVAVNSGGSGPAVVTDGFNQVRLVTQSAAPGQDLVLWGTGLGGISADETVGAPFRDMTVEANVAVYVGGKQAQTVFAGRTPGAAGLDQINFKVPTDVMGCYVPLVVTLNGLASNWTTISVAAGNGACSDPNGLSAAEMEAARTRGNLKTGSISLSRTALSMTVPGFGSLTTVSDSAGASFEKYDFVPLISAQGFGGYSSIGSCVVYQYAGETQADPVTPVYLDAGAQLTLTGQGGVKSIPLATAGQKGVYGASLGSDNGFTPPNLYLAPGSYTVTGQGGTEVGAFSSTLTVPQTLTWTNAAAVTNVPRGQNLQLTWSGGPQGGIMNIMGSSTISTPLKAGAMFFCTAPVNAGQFTVPSMVLSSLPASETLQDVPTGMLMMGAATTPVRFTASGIDVGTFMHTASTGKFLAYQ